MARVYRPTYTKPLPEGATIYERKGARLVRFADRRGQAVSGKLSNNGQRVILESTTYAIEYRDGDGIKRRVGGYTDLAATRQKAAQLERDAERQESGLIDRHVEHRKRPLLDHVAEWEKALTAKGDTTGHAEQQAKRVRTVFSGCGFTFWPDVTASTVQTFIGEMRKATKRRPKKGISARTANGYLQACRGFCNWMVKDDRAPSNPLAHLSKYSEQADRRKLRRGLDEDECAALIAAAEAGPVRYGVSGADRAMLYKAALGTGLRAHELATLTPQAMDLDGDPPTVTVLACYSKHRRQDVQPITPALTEALRAYVADKPTDAPAFVLPERTNLVKMLKADLAAAGIAYRDDSGATVDFHALRHSYISLMARAGVAPKVLMDLARHGSINLTMSFYSHTLVADRAKALDALPDLNGSRASVATARA